jgi:hypothetical protein
VTTVLLVIGTGVSLLRRWVIGKNEDPLLAILVTGLLGALIGKAIEQSAGVGKVSDLLVMWALMGLVIAAAEIDFGAVRRERRAGRTLALSNMRRLVPLGGVAVAMLVALVIFVPKDVQTLRAGWIASNGFEQKASGDADAAFRSFEQARKLAPDVERYFIESSKLLVKAAAANSDQARALDLLLTARAMLLDYESRDPLAWQSQLELARITAALVGHSDTISHSEVINRYLNVSVLMKPYARVQAQAAEQIVLAGHYELGAIISQNAIRLEGMTAPSDVGWWALGEAMFQLGRMDDAEIAWQTAVKRGRFSVYAGRSHRGLGFINEARGDLEEAAEHHLRADEIGI